MFTPRIRLILIVVATAVGCVELSRGGDSSYIPFIAAALLVIGYFRYGPIRPAFIALQRGQFDEARTLVGSIRYPSLLNGQSKAYFHWIRGVLATLEPADLATAERELKLAADGKLRTSNDRCIATAALAEVHFLAKDFDRSKSVLEEAAQISHSAAAAQILDALRARFREGNI